MANNLIRFRETTSNAIQYHNWDLLDGSNQQKYEFSMSGFNMFEKWIHLVRIDRYNRPLPWALPHLETITKHYEIGCVIPYNVMVVVHKFKL